MLSWLVGVGLALGYLALAIWMQGYLRRPLRAIVVKTRNRVQGICPYCTQWHPTDLSDSAFEHTCSRCSQVYRVPSHRQALNWILRMTLLGLLVVIAICWGLIEGVRWVISLW